jgi:hypothetical protein
MLNRGRLSVSNNDLLQAIISLFIGIGVIGAAVAHVLRQWAPAPGFSRWRPGVSGALVEMGIVSLAVHSGHSSRNISSDACSHHHRNQSYHVRAGGMIRRSD